VDGFEELLLCAGKIEIAAVMAFGFDLEVRA